MWAWPASWAAFAGDTPEALGLLVSEAELPAGEGKGGAFPQQREGRGEGGEVARAAWWPPAFQADSVPVRAHLAGPRGVATSASVQHRDACCTTEPSSSAAEEGFPTTPTAHSGLPSLLSETQGKQEGIFAIEQARFDHHMSFNF